MDAGTGRVAHVAARAPEFPAPFVAAPSDTCWKWRIEEKPALPQRKRRSQTHTIRRPRLERLRQVSKTRAEHCSPQPATSPPPRCLQPYEDDRKEKSGEIRRAAFPSRQRITRNVTIHPRTTLWGLSSVICVALYETSASARASGDGRLFQRPFPQVRKETDHPATNPETRHRAAAHDFGKESEEQRDAARREVMARQPILRKIEQIRATLGRDARRPKASEADTSVSKRTQDRP